MQAHLVAVPFHYVCVCDVLITGKSTDPFPPLVCTLFCVVYPRCLSDSLSRSRCLDNSLSFSVHRCKPPRFLSCFHSPFGVDAGLLASVTKPYIDLAQQCHVAQPQLIIRPSNDIFPLYPPTHPSTLNSTALPLFRSHDLDFVSFLAVPRACFTWAGSQTLTFNPI